MRRPSRTSRVLRRVVDVTVPLLTGLFLLAVIFDENELDRGPLFGVGVALALGQAVALCWRHSRPGLVMVLAIGGGVGSQLIAPSGLFPAAGLFAIWSLTVVRPPRVSLPAMLALIGIVALTHGTAAREDRDFVMAVVALVWALAEAVRNHRVAVTQEARRAVSEERDRISRELHDVLAHSVSVIVVQAAAADDVFDTRPDQARAALRAIETAGREALGELRLLLAAVRPGTVAGPGGRGRVAVDGHGGAGADSRVPSAAGPDAHAGPVGDAARPSPGLDRLDDVTGPLRDAGLEVAVRREGTVRPLPGAVDLSAYRIVQEALTNTLRHARATHAVVELRYGDDLLEVQVHDDGCGVSEGGRAGGGLGLVGMRERAAMLGGTVTAGPRPGGGYRVEARLPLEAPR